VTAGFRSGFFGDAARLAGNLGRIPLLLKDPKKRWWVFGAAVLVVVLAGASIYYSTVYLPAQASKQQTLQTAVARRGSIILSASGTGTLQGANQMDLAFKASGRVAQLNVKVGDQVVAGELLAQLDNTGQQLQYQQAQLALANLTSASAIGSAQKALAQATQQLWSDKLTVEYLVSPTVYYWENEVAKDELAVSKAQAAADAAPTDSAAQAALKKATDVLGFAQDKLKEAHKAYHDYVLNTFTVTRINPSTHQEETYIEYPTPADILKARQDVVIAQGALDDAKNLVTALTGGLLPKNASGSGLQALEQARLNLQTAKDNLEATQLYAPFSGTIVSVSAQLGPISSVATPVGSTASNPVRSTAVMSIADLSQLYVKTYVDESDYALFKVGKSATVVFDALPDQTLTGKVAEVDPALNTSSGSAVVSGLVALDHTSADLLLGMGASVQVISAQAQNAILVPLSALHEYAPGKYAVFVMKDGKLTPQIVEVGLQDLVSAEIKSGLQPGDVVSTGLVAVK
jgi:HlyD family secretion protein